MRPRLLHALAVLVCGILITSILASGQTPWGQASRATGPHTVLQPMVISGPASSAAPGTVTPTGMATATPTTTATATATATATTTATAATTPTPPVTPPQPPADTFVELVSARSPAGRVLVGEVAGQQVVRFQQFFEPVYFWNQDREQWQEIDTRLVADPVSGQYRNSAAGFAVQFANPGAASLQAAAPQLLHLARGGQPGLTLQLEGALPVPIVATDTITYPNVAPQADLIYQVRAWGIKEELVLRSAAAPATFSLLLDAPGVQAQPRPDGSWLLSSDTGQALWRIPAPQGADAAGVAAPLQIAVTPASTGRYRITLTTDPAWLAAPERVFPVRLDPSFVEPQYVNGETYVQSRNPTLAWNHFNRYLGYDPPDGPNGSNYKGITRIYTPINLAFLPSGVQADQILSAELVYTQYYVQNAAGFTSLVYPITAPWDTSRVTWGAEPAIASAPVVRAFVPPARGPQRWNITDWVRQVRAGATTNYGLSLRAEDEMARGGIFYSSQCQQQCGYQITNRPYLQVEVALSSGLNPMLDTWGFPNRTGAPSFADFVDEYGRPQTTYLVTDTQVLGTLTLSQALQLPISFAPAGLDALTIPLSPTAQLTATDTLTDDSVRYLPRPISYLYEKVIVSAIYDDQFTQDYLAALESGLCAGMASTAADFHTPGDGPVVGDYGGSDTVRSIPDSPVAQDLIEQYHGRQVGHQILDWLAEDGRYTPTRLVNHLTEAMLSSAWSSNPEILGIVQGARCDQMEVGHALLPYKLILLANNQARIYVYDPNYPPTSADDASNRHIDIDLATNRWSYEMAPGETWRGSVLYSIPLSLFREKPQQPHQSDLDIVSVSGGHRMAMGVSDVAFGGHRMAMGEGDDGLRTGCVNDTADLQFVREITHTYRLTPLAGLRAGQVFPDTLVFPAGRPWTFTGSGALPGNIGDLMVFGPHSVAGLLSTASDATKDSIRFDATFHTLTARTTDAPKPVSFYQLHETDAWTRVYAVSNTTLGAGETMTLTVGAGLDTVELLNNAPVSKTFELGLAQVGPGGFGSLLLPQEIGPFERRVYHLIDWANPATSPLIIDVDQGADGSIDRIILPNVDTFPAAMPIAALPAPAPGAHPLVTILTRGTSELEHIGWLNLDAIVPPGITLPAAMQASWHVALRWLSQGGDPGLAPGVGIVGVAGTNAYLFDVVGTPTPGTEAAYHIGDIMIVPLFDRRLEPQDAPLFYRMAGLAAVRITESSSASGQIRGELLFQVRYPLP